ncbi:MAG: ribonuclease HI family protein [Bdellovibrionota bacterium]
MSSSDMSFMYVDGASRGNPGQAAIGVSICDRDQKELYNLSQAIGIQTNNVAEYQALIQGCKLALSKGVMNLSVRSDSQLLVRQIAGQYRVKQPHLKPLVQEAKELLAKFASYELVHVPREENKRADALANLALDQ